MTRREIQTALGLSHRAVLVALADTVAHASDAREALHLAAGPSQGRATGALTASGRALFDGSSLSGCGL
ncbi:MAG: hypothetical protein ACC726_04635 [Chloroflexota bacterium]